MSVTKTLATKLVTARRPRLLATPLFVQQSSQYTVPAQAWDDLSASAPEFRAESVRIDKSTALKRWP